MKYQMLMWPHANARYRSETVRLALAELRLMLDVVCPDAEIKADGSGAIQALQIITPSPLTDEMIDVIRDHSLMYVLYEENEAGLLRQITGRADDYLGEDLPSILKYKGKTNESFLKMLINTALYSSDFSRNNDDIMEILDPMCGRCTSLFVAANMGWNASGSDIDKGDLAETEKFLKRYLEYHRFKYTLGKESRTIKGEKAAPVTNFVYAAEAKAFKDGDTRRIRFANADAGKIPEVFGREKFHLIVSDLPYGVQHAPGGSDIMSLLRRILPAWKAALRKGGAAAVSFNTNTLRTKAVRQLFTDAGFTVMSGEKYDGFEHWVEQAVSRDIVVARK